MAMLTTGFLFTPQEVHNFKTTFEAYSNAREAEIAALTMLCEKMWNEYLHASFDSQHYWRNQYLEVANLRDRRIHRFNIMRGKF